MKKLIVLIVLLLVSCSPKESIKIGVNSWPPCEVWYIAASEGYFENVPVEIVRFSSWSDNMASMYKGNTDITHATYYNAVYYSDKGIDATMLAPIDYVEGADGLVVKEVLSNYDKMTIGVEIGTDEHFLLAKSLDKLNLDIQEMTLKSLPSYLSHENFISGEVDALYTYEPFLSQAAQEGKGQILMTTKDLPGYMVDVLMANRSGVNSRKKDYEIIMQAWYKSLDFIKNNPDKAYKIMAEKSGMAVEDFQVFYESFNFYDSKEALNLMTTENTKNILNEMMAFTQENGLTNKVIDVDKLLEGLILEMINEE